MDDFFDLLSKWIKKTENLLRTFYYKITLLLNKQKTVHKMMQPILEEKQKGNALLLKELHRLKLKNIDMDKEIQLCIKENQILKGRIALMQELLVKNNS